MSTPSSTPARRFAPVPFETTQISSKSTKVDKSPAPRKFAVQPVETTVSSSRKSKDDHKSDSTSTTRRFAPQLVETTTESSKDRPSTAERTATRRFAPQLVETTQKNSSEAQAGKRRFAPQLVETTSRSSNENANNGKRRFTPQLVETTTSSTTARSDSSGSDKPRKFAPVIIDTASRSNRSKNTPTKKSARTEEGFSLHAQELRRHMNCTQPLAEQHDKRGLELLANSRGKSPLHIELATEMRRHNIVPFDGIKQNSHGVAAQRQHSYCLPDLETIESSGSSVGNSAPSSPASSQGRTSPFTPSENSLHGINHVTRKRESIDEGFARYLLDLEARKVQQRIQEEALLAAFPNSDYHQPVQHYMDNEEDFDMTYEIEDRPVTYGPDEEIVEHVPRRRDSTDVNWERLEMQEHAERLQQEENINRPLMKKQQSDGPWWNPGTIYGLETPSDEMRSMLNRARPPMLGQSLVFPRCSSPEPARFDITQGSAVLRQQVSQSSKRPSEEQSGDPILWKPPPGKDEPKSIGLFKSPASSTVSLKGLWGGMCVQDPSKCNMLKAPPAPSGLMTPRPETADGKNPFEQSFGSIGAALDPSALVIKTPVTPGQSNGAASLDSVLSKKKELDALMAKDYPDSFVTQVYNYLSLGYPSLARPFDAELSKITGVPMADLRSDDQQARQTSKGYIRLGPDFEGGGGDGLTEQDCARWRALKLYIREWVKQEKTMVHVDGPLGDWGAGPGARRGSWAI